VTVEKALRLAQDADLDLVEVAPQARPPVCKLMDFGKFKYESALKAREARKKATHTVIKEMKLRPKIDPHDYETKKGHVVRFLGQGDKVKITIMFRGREQHRPELGFKLLAKLAEDVNELGWVESAPKQDGRNMIMVLGPHRRKADAKAEREADKEVARARRRADDEANAQRRRARATTDGTDVAVGSGVGWGVGSGVALGSKVAVGPAFGWEAGVPASGAETGAAIGEEVQPIRARMSAPLVRLSARPESSEGNDRPAGGPNRTR